MSLFHHKLLITDQVGGSVHHLHLLFASLHCVNDKGLFAYRRQSCCYFSRMHFYCNQELLGMVHNTDMPLSSCREKVVVTICHARWDKPMKNSTVCSCIQWDISQRSQEWALPAVIWMTSGTKQLHRQHGALSVSWGTSWIPTIQSSVCWGYSKLGKVQPCM